MNVLRSSFIFSFFTLISRLFGFIRDIFVANFLGTGFSADIFFVAFRLPNTFRRLFAEGTFNAAFIPSYTSELVKKKSGSQKFANEIFENTKLSLLSVFLLVSIYF